MLLAFPLARLVRIPFHVALVVLNLWLFMELLTSLVDPGYRFGACCCRGSSRAAWIACDALVLWRQWRAWSGSVAVH